jgi:hypothetical protein
MHHDPLDRPGKAQRYEALHFLSGSEADATLVLTDRCIYVRFSDEQSNTHDNHSDGEMGVPSSFKLVKTDITCDANIHMEDSTKDNELIHLTPFSWRAHLDSNRKRGGSVLFP